MLHHRHGQALTHSSIEEITQQRGRSRVNRGAGESLDVCPHLERDPLVLSSLTEGMSEEEDIIHSDTQSQEW